MEMRVLALDIGSSSVRAGLFDIGGALISPLAKRVYETATDVDGRAEVDPDMLFGLVCTVLDDICLSLVDGEAIVAVSVSCFWHSLLGLDAHGRPLMPLMTWADTRASDEAADLRLMAGADAVRRTTGSPWHASFWPAKLRWLARARPDVTRCVASWVSACDYIFLRLLGDGSTSVSMASGTGLFDQNGLRYSSAALACCNVVQGQIPSVGTGFRPPIRPDFATRWPALGGVPWLGAFGDGACSNIGAGCVDRDALVIMLGTSGSMRMVWEAERAGPSEEAVWCYRVDARRFASGMALSEGGNVAAWARRVLNLPMSEEALEHAVASALPGGHGVAALPFVVGQRSPAWNASRTAALTGMRQSTSALDIYVSLLESVALQFAALKRQLDRAHHPARKIIATGSGFTSSPAWTAMVADALGEPVSLSPVAETSLRGAALLALEALGHISRLDAPSLPKGRTFQPRAERHLVYRQMGERQARLDALMADNTGVGRKFQWWRNCDEPR